MSAKPPSLFSLWWGCFTLIFSILTVSAMVLAIPFVVIVQGHLAAGLTLLALFLFSLTFWFQRIIITNQL